MTNHSMMKTKIIQTKIENNSSIEDYYNSKEFNTWLELAKRDYHSNYPRYTWYYNHITKKWSYISIDI